MINPSRVRPSALVVLFLAVFLSGVALGRWQVTTEGARATPTVVSPQEFPKEINAGLVREVWDLLHEKFAGDIEDKKLSQGVLRGLVGGLGDPYSAYADPEETSQFAEDLSGSFTGIGVEIGLRRGVVTVIAPLRDSPAEKSGIRARDVIVSIDGKDITPELSLTEVVTRIRGPAGSTVTLGMFREGDDGPRKITVRRERIEIKSVTGRVEKDVGIIELSAFHEDTAQRFRELTREFLASGVKRIVLDLRNNPGGVLEVAVVIAGHFVDEGQLVVKEVPADPSQTVEHRAKGPGDLKKMPVVVVMNEGSASAAEILAAVLRDARHVKLIGAQTFGKGTVQELIDLSDGSSVRITIAKWVTPSGKELTEQGLEPDISVKDPNPDDTDDVVLKRALEELARQ